MSLDDPRVEWIRRRVCSAFNLTEPTCFEELLNRHDGEDGQKIVRFLNEVTEDEAPSAILFCKQIREEEIEVPVCIGKVTNVWFSLPLSYSIPRTALLTYTPSNSLSY